MTSQEFIDIAKEDGCINAYLHRYPTEVQDELERVSHKTLVKILLLKAGEKIIDILINFLQELIIRKYGNK